MMHCKKLYNAQLISSDNRVLISIRGDDMSESFWYILYWYLKDMSSASTVIYSSNEGIVLSCCHPRVPLSGLMLMKP